MEVHPTPFPVKSQCMKPKSTRKISEDPAKVNPNVGAPLLREKRVFGSARNPNVPVKTATEKPGKAKPSSGLLKGAAKSFPETRSPLSGQPNARTKNSSEKNRRRKMCVFRKKRLEDMESAEKCRLETSAYWLDQIKLAESAGKHSVSAAFFQLASECKAEPVRNIRVELKKYLSRHEHLNTEEVWKKVSFSHGLVKEESSQNEGNGKAGDEEANASGIEDQEDKDLQKEIGEENETWNVQ
ncbi:UNVERIFIED_CONTAM: hypothetical protein Slati_0649100 [Sesamum latifolium]|uniref:Uncharacterized protein n=1 Tax=Sesamum latifolium TaxID=2727402 RepID=A0AAW2Y3D5_9LAMI